MNNVYPQWTVVRSTEDLCTSRRVQHSKSIDCAKMTNKGGHLSVCANLPHLHTHLSWQGPHTITNEGGHLSVRTNLPHVRHTHTQTHIWTNGPPRCHMNVPPIPQDTHTSFSHRYVYWSSTSQSWVVFSEVLVSSRSRENLEGLSLVSNKKPENQMSRSCQRMSYFTSSYRL